MRNHRKKIKNKLNLVKIKNVIIICQKKITHKKIKHKHQVFGPHLLNIKSPNLVYVFKNIKNGCIL